MSVERTESERGERRISERPAKSLDIEIGGRFPLILNKEHKVVLFPPGFQTVQNPPGVKHDPLSLSLFLLISRPLILFVLLSMPKTSLATFRSPPPPLSPPPLLSSPFPSRSSLGFDCGTGAAKLRSFTDVTNSISRPRPLFRRKGGNRRRGYITKRELSLSLSYAIVRVTVGNLPRFFQSFSFSPFEEKLTNFLLDVQHASV